MFKLKHSSRFVAFGIVLALALFSGWLVINRHHIVDTIKARQFTPSSEVRTIRDDLALTDYGTLVFDASFPQLQQSAEFNDSCNQRRETNNPIIGCYTRQTIYIYDSSREELDGIEETTAAHELLHAAYERLNAQEKKDLNAELVRVYDRLKTSQLEERLDYYKKSEPGYEVDELHSIIGTEFDSIGSTLEKHYAKYFTNRQKIVNYYQAYNGVFNRISQEMKSLESKINQDVASINERISDYNKQSNDLKSDTTAFNRQAQDGDFSSQAAFAAERSRLVARADALETERQAINAAIATSNKDRATYNELVKEYNQLSRSINSSLAPSPSL